MSIRVEIDGGATAFEPGQDVTGSVSWSFDAAPKSIEVRLFWRTEGRGTQDAAIAAVEKIAAPEAQGKRSFRLRLPAGPCSFSGKLISLVWAVEAVGQPGSEADHADIVSGPGGNEIRFGQ